MRDKRLGFQGWKDLRYFLQWELVFVFVGTAGFAVLEGDVISRTWSLFWFIVDWKVPVIVALVALIVLPPALSKGWLHLRARRNTGLRNVEMATALYGLQSRAANLIVKMQEAFAGKATNTYQHHSLQDCQKYFATRPLPENHNRLDTVIVEANYYALEVKSRSKLLERKLFTNTDATRMRPSFSTRGTGEDQLAVERISNAKHIYCQDLREEEFTRPLKILNGAERPYRTFLSVPVLRDRQSQGDDRVIGMLSVNVSHPGIIHESDQHILNAYAWFLSAAFAADELSRTRQVIPA